MPEKSIPPAPTATAHDIVHAPLLRYFPETVIECGGDPQSLLSRFGIGPAQSRPGEQLVSYRQTAELLDRAALELDRPDFGLLLASRQCDEGMVGPLGEVMRHCRQFGDVLALAAEHGYAHSLASHSWLSATPNRSVMLGHDILLDGLFVTGQMIEQILLIGHLTAMRLTGGWVGARSIFFRHKPMSPLALYRRFFGCPVSFDQRCNATLYHAADLTRPILFADNHAFQQMLAAVEARFTDRHIPLSRKVRGLLLPVLAQEHCTAEWVAGALGLHPRTLFRRLRLEATTFRRIRDRLRRDCALYYLTRTELDASQISQRLGYSEQSVLTRSCQRWFGQSPITMLRQRQAGEPGFALGNR